MSAALGYGRSGKAFCKASKSWKDKERCEVWPIKPNQSLTLSVQNDDGLNL